MGVIFLITFKSNDDKLMKYDIKYYTYCADQSTEHSKTL